MYDVVRHLLGRIAASLLQVQLRATTPPGALAAIEQAAATQFDRDQTTPFGRDLLRRIAIDNAVAAHFQLPSFAEWQATQDPQEGHGDETP
jgi:hypothetical protein